MYWVNNLVSVSPGGTLDNHVLGVLGAYLIEAYGAPNFDSKGLANALSPSILHSISHFLLDLSPKNKLVHQTNICDKISLQKLCAFEVLLLLTNTIPDEQLIGNA